MPEPMRVEFTGERVIPGLVEDSLFNEHLARYRFAARLIHDLGLQGSFVDAGCGAGYGSAQLAAATEGASVLGIDVAEEAVAHARGNYGEKTNLRFEQASCTAIPVPDESVRLLTTFEVIEHLPDWRQLLREAARALEPGGLFLVSTPNQFYYAESRRTAGPNPFHVHEFTFSEFQSELAVYFPEIAILLQNHVEGIALTGADTAGSLFEISERPADPDSANFFLAICSKKPLPKLSNFVYLPDTGNVLKTRERHIELLNQEIRQKEEWIAKEQGERDRMLEKVREMEFELEEHNSWARKANEEAERRAQLVASLQAELKQSNEWARLRDAEAKERAARIEELQAELARSNEWAGQRDAEAKERGARIEQLQTELATATAWATSQDAEAKARGARIEELQKELATATAWATSQDAEAKARGVRIVQLQDELAEATAWAQSLDNRMREEIARLEKELEERSRLCAQLQAEVEEKNRWAKSIREDYEAELDRTRAGYEAAIDQWRREKKAADEWALDTERQLHASEARVDAKDAEIDKLRTELESARAQMRQIAQSRWVRLGRLAKVGPEIPQD